MKHRAAIILSLGALACGPGEPSGPLGTPRMVVGAGPDDGSPGYIEIDDDVELTLHPGAQGGFHVYVNLRFTTDMGKPLIQRWVRRADTSELVSRSKHTSTLVPSPSGDTFDTAASIPVFLCPSPVGIAVADQPLILEVEAGLDEDDPDPVKDTIRFTPRCPAEHEDFCRRICFG